ncbi:MAG: radical SAM protein [Gemmataceae bacterium]|nr:radical SAM protein [Gemmataceae bacterium]
MDYMQQKARNKALNYEEIRSGATYLKSRPLFFWFDLNGSCNLECAHCGFHLDGRTSEQEVADDIYAKIMAELMPTAYVCNLGGTNWGEMTIAKSFGRFLRDCKAHQVKINLTTNGTRMSDEWFDDLLETLTVIGFSMEGMAEQFEQMRGFKWRFFLKNVEKVCQGRADRGKDFRIEWRFCAHADNIHQLPDMIRLAHSIGVDRIQVMNLTPYLPAQKFKMLFYHRSLANRYFEEARTLAQQLGVQVNVPSDFATGTFDTAPLLQIGLPGKSANGAAHDPGVLEMVNCFHPWQTCSINELGNVKPCCIYWRSMGSIANNNFASVWNGRRYRKLRRQVNQPGSNDICHSCRLPKFDSEQNTSFAQTLPGIRDIFRSLLTFRRKPKVIYDGVMSEQFDPRPAPNGQVNHS